MPQIHLKGLDLSRKKIVVLSVVILFGVMGFLAFSYAMKNKRGFAITSLSALGKVSKFLPIGEDEKKELDVVNSIVADFTKKDDVEKTFFILLQNDTELRPGGGFLGQYAVVKTKNGEVLSTFVEDANLLDQRIQVKIPAPFPFERMMQIKKWKFRDSNFSPDFPTNVQKAEYFYRLSGRSSASFDGVIAVNSQVFDDIIGLTGPITVPGYSGEYNSTNASRKLEEQVEKAYIMDPELDTQNRKDILKKMAPLIMDKLLTIGNAAKIAELFHNELKNRNIMLNFNDRKLQEQVAGVHWDGAMPVDWTGDYLMAVDANMGALKSDYYIRREMDYDIDFTGQHPVVTLNIRYKHTATAGDWRTSDYHSYLRLYVPKGSTLLENKMVNNVAKSEDFDKTYFGFKLDVLIGQQTDAMIKYQLPDSITADNYKLLIQKQSGAGDVPMTFHIKTGKEEVSQQQTLKDDLKFELRS